MVALNAMTGDYQWHFQVVHHDTWDYDCPSNTLMFNQNIGGVSTPVVAEPCKTGWVYEINRTNGNPATQIDEKAVPTNAFQNGSTTQPIPAGDPFSTQCADKAQYPDLAADGKPFIIGCIWQPFDDQQFAATAPGAGGGNNWNPASYNPNTGFMYVCNKNTTNAYKSIPNASATYVGGRTFIGLQFGATAPGVIQTGDFVAMNMSTTRSRGSSTTRRARSRPLTLRRVPAATAVPSPRRPTSSSWASRRGCTTAWRPMTRRRVRSSCALRLTRASKARR